MKFCICGSIITDGICSNRHCTVTDSKADEWLINGVSIRFKEKVTYAEAQKHYNAKSDLIKKYIEKPLDDDANEIAKSRRNRLRKRGLTV